MGLSLAIIVLALGLRHGLDPDHLAAVDGLAQINRSRWNGLVFAIGHGLLVTVASVGFGKLAGRIPEEVAPGILIVIGLLSLYRVCRPRSKASHIHVFTGSPLILGIVFAAGFETASQLSVFALANRVSGWTIGACFSLGMILINGLDGFLAGGIQRADSAQLRDKVSAARLLGVFVGTSSVILGTIGLLGLELGGLSLPIGLLMFLTIIVLRLRSRRTATLVGAEQSA